MAIMDSVDMVSKGKFYVNLSMVGRILSVCLSQEPFVCLASSDYRGYSVKGEFYQRRILTCLAFHASALI